MYSKIMLMIARWCYGMPFDANGRVSTLNVDWLKWVYFCFNDFEVSVNDSIFPGSEQQKV